MTDGIGAAQRRAAFLAAQNLSDVRIVPLAGDASARRYYRIPGRGCLLMEDPTDPVGFRSYLRVAAHLNALGLSAPVVHAVADDGCLALIEDWGDATYAQCLARRQSEQDLYALAVDALLHLHRAPGAADLRQPLYDRATWMDELRIFCDWFVPAVAPDLDQAAFRRGFLALWDDALAPLYDQNTSLVLRDFHVDNLMVLDGRMGVAGCGLLDFQDAVIGPPEYDLVSLLQDARRDLAPGLEDAMLARYCAGFADASGAGIRARYALMGAQRHTRIAGVFVRLCQRDGKARYLQWLPRVLRQLDAALDAAGLVDIRRHLEQAVPDWQNRGVALADTTRA